MCDNGQCVNTEGGFRCVCDPGYELDNTGGGDCGDLWTVAGL